MISIFTEIVSEMKILWYTPSTLVGQSPSGKGQARLAMDRNTSEMPRNAAARWKIVPVKIDNNIVFCDKIRSENDTEK